MQTLPTALVGVLVGALMAMATAITPAAGLPAVRANELELYQQRMGQLFQQLDRNGDGRLDRQEAQQKPLPAATL
jgi:Ca2+-binding EF-hand superfamily protein